MSTLGLVLHKTADIKMTKTKTTRVDWMADFCTHSPPAWFSGNYQTVGGAWHYVTVAGDLPVSQQAAAAQLSRQREKSSRTKPTMVGSVTGRFGRSGSGSRQC